MQVTESKLQSKWGYHPCDYQTFVKLRRLHKLMWETMRQLGRLRSWERKLPQNRKGPRPLVSPLADYLDLYPRSFDPPNRILPDQDLIHDYRYARYPRVDAVLPFPHDSRWLCCNDLDDVLQKTEEWFAANP